MALQKQIALRTGVNVNYLVVKEMLINFDQQYARIHLVGYLNKAARDAGADPAWYDTIEFYSDTFPFTTQALSRSGANPQKAAYNALKERTPKPGDNDYSDATDV